ncbi:MAG: hypothetical protein KJ734_08335, partial [Chloroflexi bacterium]|nr:hypothetical protein [Chloroflexota bacterium]
MNQREISWIRIVSFVVATASLLVGLSACNMPNSTTTGGATRPVVVIAAPANGSQVAVGQPTT